MAFPGRDPRRLFSQAERAQIAARQHHLCEVCSGDLPEAFHVHHVIPWADGGPTHPDNGVAVCPDCHRNAEVRTPSEFVPRLWQEEALPHILPLLRAGEFATLSAAPGAGKTEFTAWTFTNLRATGDALRIVVFGPNTHLRTQWRDVCANRGIYLRADSVTERRGEDGVVVTYHALIDPAKLQQLIDDAAETPTLFVLDEVHHLAKRQQYVGVDVPPEGGGGFGEVRAGGEAGAWAVNIARLVGTPDRPTHPVLNLSGTLFRSVRSERITTIRYTQVGDQIETVADYSITAGRLISERQLRHIKVLGYDADMTLHRIDLAEAAHQDAETIRAVNLDDDAKLRSQVLPEMVRDPRFIKGIINETVTWLGHASVALGGAPVKGLIIADSIQHAEQVYDTLVDAVGGRCAFVAHGDRNDADREIERFRASREQAVMVAVQKITEGYDVPDICVLTYLRTWRAPLFINQMVGRAMRITDRERELSNYLPATVLVPNDTEVKAAFADVLVGAMNVLAAPPDPCPRCDRDNCVCPPRPKGKICPGCGQSWKFCDCPCRKCGLTMVTGCECWRKPSPICFECGKQERYCICEKPPAVVVMSDPEMVHVNVDGNDVDLAVIDGIKGSMEERGLPRVYLEEAAAGLQEQMRKDPMTFLTFLKGDQR